jgi:hypothetical protein
MHHQTNQEEHEEYHEQDLGNSGRGKCHETEPEGAGDQRDQQEN